MLGHLRQADEEELELRLLRDASYVQEFDITVNELIDQYIAGELQDVERKQAEQYFLRSDERLSKLNFALALQKQASKTKSSVKRDRGTQILFSLLAASILLVLGLGLGIRWWLSFHPSEVDKALLALNKACGENRPVESRISALKYAPFSQTRGSANNPTNENDIREAELRLQAAFKKNPSPDIHHALGSVYLAERKFDSAIGQFNDALKSGSEDPKIYSDLGAASLEKGKLLQNESNPQNGLEEFNKALKNLNRALELNGSLLDALFNRALCYEQMKLLPQAEEAWRNYLLHDGTSGWALEAKSRLDHLLTKADLN